MGTGLSSFGVRQRPVDTRRGKLKDDAHARAEQHCAVGLRRVRGMDGYLHVRPDFNTFRKPQPVEGLNHPLLPLALPGTRRGPVKGRAKEVTAPAERLGVYHADGLDLLGRRPFIGRYRKTAEGRPSIAELVIEADAAAMSAAQLRRVVAPEHTAVVDPLAAGYALEPANFDRFEILAIDQRLDVSLLRALGV